MRNEQANDGHRDFSESTKVCFEQIASGGVERLFRIDNGGQ
jgi:hypothetical protein